VIVKESKFKEEYTVAHLTDKENEQVVRFEKFKAEQVSKGLCPYSGLMIKECKSWLCDCFEWENEYGLSQK
jgi:hypothetical protein